MNIIVLIKQVPDTNDVKIDRSTGNLIREGVPTIVNPYDIHAVEEALRLKEKFGGETTAISMGPPQAIDALQEVIAMGIENGILLTDKAFAGADTLATAYSLGRCIEKIGKFDIILCGFQAIDGDTAQVGPQVAEYLNIPQLTYVRDLKVDGEKLLVERVLEDGYEKVESTIPALITVVKSINKPRYPRISSIITSCSDTANIKTWNAADIRAVANETGINGSPTVVKQVFTPKLERKGETLSGDTESIVQELVEKLKGKKIL